MYIPIIKILKNISIRDMCSEVNKKKPTEQVIQIVLNFIFSIKYNGTYKSRIVVLELHQNKGKDYNLSH